MQENNFIPVFFLYSADFLFSIFSSEAKEKPIYEIYPLIYDLFDQRNLDLIEIRHGLLFAVMDLGLSE